MILPSGEKTGPGTTLALHQFGTQMIWIARSFVERKREIMFLQWMKSRKQFVAIGVALITWATLQNEGIASSEFLTDRIGEGSILQVSEPISPMLNDGRVLYFQEGHPINVTQIKGDQPYCKFQTTGAKLSERLAQQSKLVVKFKNVTRARWFFTNDVELECMAPKSPSQDHETFRESDFRRVLGHFFQVEMRSVKTFDNRQI